MSEIERCANCWSEIHNGDTVYEMTMDDMYHEIRYYCESCIKKTEYNRCSCDKCKKEK
jgi:hypothetical protein